MKYALYRKFDELVKYIVDRNISISGYDDNPLSTIRALCDINEVLHGKEYKGGI